MLNKMIGSLIIATSLASGFSLSGLAQSDSATGAGEPAGPEVSQGERVEIEGKGFSMAPPAGWTIQKNLPRSSLFLRAVVAEGQYPRNISVIRHKEPVMINESTAELFAGKIVREFPAASSTIEGYTLRNHQSVQMSDGREGILFYTDFNGSGRKMMQAHILVSSETNHYLVTYTDVAENFENPGEGNQLFSDAWASMTSIQLDSPNPVPSKGLEMVGLGLLFGFFAVTSVAVWRKWLAAKVYRRYGDLEPGEEVGDDMPKTNPSGVSHVSEVATMKIQDVSQELSDDSGIRSGFAQKILKFRSKKSDEPGDSDIGSDQVSDVSGDDQGLEFTQDINLETKKPKWKKGA